MDDSDYITHYDSHYAREGEHGAGQLVWEPQYELWKQAGYEPGMSVLDYGCGVGVMIECGIEPEDYHGVDISKEAIKLARQRYPKYAFSVFTPGALLPLPSTICVAQSVFTHTPKTMVQKCLDDIHNNFVEFAIIDILHGEDNPADEHVRYFTPDEWHDYLWRSKLSGERLGEYDFVGFNHIYYKVTHER